MCRVSMIERVSKGSGECFRNTARLLTGNAQPSPWFSCHSVDEHTQSFANPVGHRGAELRPFPKKKVDNVVEKHGFAFVAMPYLEQAELAMSSLLLQAVRKGDRNFRVEFSRNDGTKKKILTLLLVCGELET